MLDRMPCEVTAVIPTLNAMEWLGMCLMHLKPGFQSAPIKLILVDNDSTDGTGEFLEWLATSGQVRDHWLEHFQDITILIPQPRSEKENRSEAINDNLERMWAALSAAVDTKYVLYVDADVCVPVGSVRTMIETLQLDPDLAAAGIMYDPTANHVKQGCMLVRSNIARKLRWQSKGCPCAWVNEEVERMGRTIRHISGLSARHIKLESGRVR